MNNWPKLKPLGNESAPVDVVFINRFDAASHTVKRFKCPKCDGDMFRHIEGPQYQCYYCGEIINYQS
jgi:uncharacterized protein (DUF983 family)